MPNPARRAIALAVLAAAIIAGAVALDLPSVVAQSDDEAGRIVARRLDDGRTEFGWQPTGGERVLPSARYFPTDAQVGRWLNSSPVEVEGVAIGRINARMLADGRIEFGFTPTDGERILPSSRYFPVDARVGRWLRSTEIEISAAAAAGFVAVSAGVGYSCAIRAGSGAIECWGWNVYGQTDAPAGRFSTVSDGETRACAIRAGSGAIVCWGWNNAGQPANPTGSFSAVSAGSGHTCAIRDDGAIECWGNNSTTVWLGEDTSEEAHTGQLDAPSGSFTAISAGSHHTCGLRNTGAIECWGSNNGLEWNEEIGASVVVHSGQAIPPAGNFSAVSAGSYHTCGLRDTGAIECWGHNWGGQIDAPAGPFTAVSAGSGHSCGLRESGAIVCWGRNDYGETDAPAGSFTAVSAGLGHNCAIREGGAIVCWGWNEDGQTDAPTP